METKLIINDTDLDEFNDIRARLLTYYIGHWYTNIKFENNDNKQELYKLYMWLVDEKPTTELIASDNRFNSIMMILGKFGADDGDEMGSALLFDLKIHLEELMQ